MRAAVVVDTARPPALTEFDEPPAEAGEVATVLAAALNPVDVAIASGGFPLRPAQAPFVAGYSGVAERPDGTRVYFEGAPLPFGSLAERVPLTADSILGGIGAAEPVPAAAIGVGGVAAWLALTRAGEMRRGDHVAVLGAAGSAGSLAVQAARALGAATVTGVARGEDDLRRARENGVDAAVDSGEGLAERLASAAPDGFDVIVDFLWGDVVPAALGHARPGARLAQVGNQAGPTAQLDAGWRNRGARLVGHSNFLASAEDRRNAYAEVVGRVAAGQMSIPTDVRPLDAVGDAWSLLSGGGARGRLVLTP